MRAPLIALASFDGLPVFDHPERATSRNRSTAKSAESAEEHGALELLSSFALSALLR
jgi:hypothetical protein